MTMPTPKQKAGWIVAGLLIGGLAVAVAVFAGGGGHGSYLPAAVLFPFAMLLAVGTGSVSAVALVIAVLQYPTYGLLAAFSGQPRRVLTITAVVHALLAIVAAAMVARSTSFTSALA